MAKKISSNDLFEQEDLFKGVRDSATKTLAVFNDLQNELKQTAQSLKGELTANTQATTAQLKQLGAATEQANKLMKQSIEIEKLKAQANQQKIKADQELVKLEKLKAQEAARANKEAEKAAQIAAKNAKASQDQNNAYKQLEKSTRDLKNQSKELGAQMLKLEESGKRNSAQYEKLAAKYKLVTQAAQQGDAQLKNLDRTVGDNFRNVGNYAGVIEKLRFGLGQLGVAFGIQQVVGLSTKALVSFDEEAANIAKTVGTTTEEAKALSRELLKIDTRTSVENLQKIASIGGQLGIGKNDIIGFTGAIDKLNVSLGDEFKGGAEEITSTIGGLRNVLSDIKTSKVSDDLLNIGNALNVLGAEGSATSPVMSDFAGRIGGVGVPLGLTSAQVLGLSATLQELNVTSERGGTAVGNILKKMAEDTAGFSKIAGMSTSEFANLVNTDIMGAFMKVVEGTKQFNGNAVGLAQTLDGLKLDGAGASEVFLKLANNTDLLRTRTGQANEALKSTSSITDEFSKKNETLQAKIDKLKNSFDKYVLGVDESGNVTGAFGTILDFLANNLGTIINLIIKVGSAWLIYKAAIQAVNAANFFMNGGLQKITQSLAAMIPGTRAARLEQIQLARAQQQVGTTANGAGTAVKGFGQSIKSIGWVALIATLAELAVAWYDIASGAAEARRQQDMFNRSKENADKKAQELQGKTQGAIDESIRKLDLELRTRKKNGESEAKLEAERAQRTKKIIAGAKSEYDAKTKVALSEANTLWHRKKFLEEEAALPFYLRKRDYEKTKKELDEVTEQYNTVTITYNNLAKGQKSFNDQLEEAAVKTIETSGATEEYNVSIADNTHLVKANSQAKQENVDLTREIQDEQIKAITDESQRAQTQLIIDAQRRIEDIQKTVADKNQKATLIKQIEANLLIELDKLDKEYYDKKEQEEKERLQKQAEEAEWLYNYRKELAEKEREENTKLYEDSVAFEDKQNQAKLASLSGRQKEEFEERLQFWAELDKLNKLKQDGAFASQEDYEKAVANLKKKYNTVAQKLEEEKWKTTQEFAQKTTDFFKKQSDQRIKKIEEEIAAAQKQADYYKQLAANGNINAQQSLAEQERIIAESNRRKEREQKRQQRMELANTIYQTYAGHAANDPETALMKTIKDASLLQAFINTLPMFYDGTEDTGRGGGVDGKGGFHAVLHPHERVIPKSLNDQIGSLTNEQLTRLAMEYNNGRLVGQDVAHSSMDLAVLVNKLDTLTEVIKHKPETNIELGEITQSAMEIVKTTRKGNTTVYNRFKVRS